MLLYALADHHLRVLLYGAGVQLAGNRGQPEALGRADSGHPSGPATADYIDGVLTRLTGAGALYLVAVCLVPDILRNAWHVPFYFGGTSLLIVVVVVMDFTAQIQAHLVSHQYESLLKKANLRGR